MLASQMFIRGLTGADFEPCRVSEAAKDEFVTARVSIEVHGRKRHKHKALKGRTEVVC
jgi:hypothetical protein